MKDRARARELASEFAQKGDVTGWFESLYREAEAGKGAVPWVGLRPNSHLLDFWKNHPLESNGKTALVIGCGVGDDAQQLADWGFQTTAFDISETAVRVAQKRFPAHATQGNPTHSSVEFLTANLLDPPPSWSRHFDFVLEIYTVQALPVSLRSVAIQKIAQFLSPGGHLLVVARGRDESEPPGEMPWPLTRQELSEFTGQGLQEISFEDYPDPEEPDTRRFRVLYHVPLHTGS